MIHSVKLGRQVEKVLFKLPKHIVVNLMAWVDDVENNSLEEARRRSGYHDEALKGDRKGQRSIRLSRSYRAVYEILENGAVQFVYIREVTKHEY